MKQFKKILALALSIAMLGSLFAGCSKKEENAEPTPEPTESVTPEVTETPQDGTQPTEAPAEGNGNAPGTKPTDKPASNTTAKPTSKPASGNSGSSNNGGQGSSNTQAPSKPTEAPATSVSLSSLMSKMVGALPSGSHSLSQIPGDLYSGVYGINKSKFEDVLIYGSTMGTKANEIILIKAKDSAGVSEAKKMLQNRKNTLTEQYKSYLPEQYELVKQSVITSNGLYAAFVCANSQGSAVSAFNSATK